MVCALIGCDQRPLISADQWSAGQREVLPCQGGREVIKSLPAGKLLEEVISARLEGLRSEESQMWGFFRQDTSEPKYSRIAAQSLRIEGGADCCRACCEPAWGNIWASGNFGFRIQSLKEIHKWKKSNLNVKIRNKNSLCLKLASSEICNLPSGINKERKKALPAVTRAGSHLSSSRSRISPIIRSPPSICQHRSWPSR